MRLMREGGGYNCLISWNILFIQINFIFYRKTPYLVPGTTCVFLFFFSMVVPGTKCSQKKFGKFFRLKKWDLVPG
jgi:hypothetical protein